MITKLLTGSRLLLDEDEVSGDIDYKIIVDNSQSLLELDEQVYKKYDTFIVDISKPRRRDGRLDTGEKESIFYLLMTWLLHKKLGLEIENEEFFLPFINEMLPNLREMLVSSIIGLSAEISKMKWAWWIWIAIKYIKGDWESISIEDIKSVFRHARTNSLTESERIFIEDFMVEEILLKDEIMRVRGVLTERQLLKIEQYNSRHKEF